MAIAPELKEQCIQFCFDNAENQGKYKAQVYKFMRKFKKPKKLGKVKVKKKQKRRSIDEKDLQDLQKLWSDLKNYTQKQIVEVINEVFEENLTETETQNLDSFDQFKKIVKQIIDNKINNNQFVFNQLKDQQTDTITVNSIAEAAKQNEFIKISERQASELIQRYSKNGRQLKLEELPDN